MAKEPPTVASFPAPPNVPDQQREVAATNRPSGVMSAREVVNYTNDPVVNMLEGSIPAKRGSRRKPTVLKYPFEIGTPQFPHVMQFKIFWRWEAKQLKDIKAESEKRLQILHSLKDLLDRGQLNENGLKSLGPEQSEALRELLYDRSVIPPINPAINEDLATLLQRDPVGAKSLVEQTISSYQTRVSSLEAETGDGSVNISEDERYQINSRVSTTLEEASVGSAAVSGFLAAGGAAAVSSLVSGKNWKSALKDGAVAGAGGAAVAAGALALAKVAQNPPKYDQMVSIYLPVCTKIGNEDTFVYEDASGAAVSAIIDALGGGMQSSIDSMAQAGVAGGIYLANKAGLGGAATSASGLVINPRLEKVFKAKDFRTFNFAWDFHPRNPDEAQYIRDIIETFRYHSNPSFDEQLIGENPSNAKIILRAPAEFTIRFLSTTPNPQVAGFVENEYIPKIARCALTSINVDYTTNGLFSTFRDNSPTAVTLTLSFQEIETLTREAVERGF